jgi:hypothetical protein
MPKCVLSHLLEGKKVVALGHKAQCRPHSSWQESDDSHFIVLTSLVKKWRAKNFDATCDFLFAPNKKSHFVASHQKC